MLVMEKWGYTKEFEGEFIEHDSVAQIVKALEGCGLVIDHMQPNYGSQKELGPNPDNRVVFLDPEGKPIKAAYKKGNYPRVHYPITDYFVGVFYDHLYGQARSRTRWFGYAVVPLDTLEPYQQKFVHYNNYDKDKANELIYCMGFRYGPDNFPMIT